MFPKNGSDSVGVARQFVNSAGRLINCQSDWPWCCWRGRRLPGELAAAASPLLG